MNDKIKKPKKKSSDKSESSQAGTEKQKGLSLFDHINHIAKSQDPDYYNSLTDLDKKTFNHFMILRGLSMNPKNLEDVSFLYRYFDAIPSPQFYKLLILIIPAEHPSVRHPWIKASKKSNYTDELIELVTEQFESSKKEAIEYIDILNNTESGKKELHDICRGFGKTEREIEKILSNDE